MLGETVDEDVFGGRGGLVFAAQVLEKVVEGVLAFGRKDEELAAEAVFEAILGRDGFAFSVEGPVECCAFSRLISARVRGASVGRFVELGTKFGGSFVKSSSKSLGGVRRRGFGVFGEFASAALFGATDLARCHL